MGIGWVAYQKGGLIIGSSWKSHLIAVVGPFDGYTWSYNLYPFIFGHLAVNLQGIYSSKWLVTVGVVVVPNEQGLWEPFRPWPWS